MALEDKQSFLPDPNPGMTIEEKNRYLSAKLGVGPLVSRKIVTIDRIEIGGTGWMVHYRTGSS